MLEKDIIGGFICIKKWSSNRANAGFHPDEEFSTSKKNAFAKFAPHHVEPLWRVKMLPFSPFNSSSLHKFNQLSNKNALRWGVRGKECFVVWWWEFEGERENKVQRKTTIEIWLLFLEKLLIGLEEGSGFVWIEEKPKGTKLTFRKQVCDVCMKVKDYFCKVVAGGVFLLRDSNYQCCLYCFLSLRWRFPLRFCLKFLCWFLPISFICVS